MAYLDTHIYIRWRQAAFYTISRHVLPCARQHCHVPLERLGHGSYRRFSVYSEVSRDGNFLGYNKMWGGSQ